MDLAIAELKTIGCEIYSQLVDVAELPQIASFADNVCKHYGHIDIWVNNAATNLLKPQLETTLEDWDNVLNTNLRSYFFASQYAIHSMVEKNVKGVIVNVSSYASILPALPQSLYAATKSAINSMTRTFAAEVARYGIRVVAVTPGWIKTERAYETIGDTDMNGLLAEISLQRMGEPEEIAKPIVFLASDASEYITGVHLEISGGKFSVQRPWAGWF
jgi:NAD(P)-dependent dehydrogenase (short-subunit alcohol dehydrogenase family)